MQAYPYRLVGASVKAEVRKTLHAVLDQWSREWFISLPAYEVRIDDVIPVDLEWHARRGSSDDWVASAAKERAQRDFTQLLFGQAAGSTPSALLADVWHECVTDLMKRLQPADSGESMYLAASSLDGLHIGAGGGALYAGFEGGLPLHGLALGGAWVEQIGANVLPAPRADVTLTPRHMLLSKGSTRIELSLGKAELPLSELATIAVGDVLSLDISYKDPLPLRTIDGQALCKAYLGRMGQNKAIQIIGK